MALKTTDSKPASTPKPTTPPGVEWSESQALERIEAISQNARTTWFGLLGLLAFVMVTLLGVQDIDFFGYDRETKLPLIGVSVPTSTFFWAAPILTAAIYAYFHFYLMKLWDALGRAPARISAAQPWQKRKWLAQDDALGDRIHPWLVSDAALLFRFKEGATTARPLRWISAATSIILTWVFGWVTLLYAWIISWPAHIWYISFSILLCLLFTLFVGFSSLFAMWRRVRSRNFTHNKLLSRRSAGIIFVAAVISLGGMLFTYAKSVDDDHLSPLGLPRLAKANLFEASIARKPDNWLDRAAAEVEYRKTWCTRRNLDWPLCVKSPSQRQLDARLRWCNQHLEPADYLDKSECIHLFASAEDAFQTEWESRRANSRASLRKPNLEGRDLRGANMIRAFLTGVDFEGANFIGANLRRAQLEAANLRSTKLQRASFYKASLDDVDLWKAEMDFNNFYKASLVNANFERSPLRHAMLVGANLSGADGLEQGQLDDAIGDHRTILPIVDGEPLYVWSCWEKPPESLDLILEPHSPAERKKKRKQWLCGPEGRKKTGRTANR